MQLYLYALVELYVTNSPELPITRHPALEFAVDTFPDTLPIDAPLSLVVITIGLKEEFPFSNSNVMFAASTLFPPIPCIIKNININITTVINFFIGFLQTFFSFVHVSSCSLPGKYT